MAYRQLFLSSSSLLDISVFFQLSKVLQDFKSQSLKYSPRVVTFSSTERDHMSQTVR